MPEVQTSFKCICGAYEGWLGDGETTQTPCPNCGRIYKCEYNKKKYYLEVKEIKPTGGGRLKQFWRSLQG